MIVSEIFCFNMLRIGKLKPADWAYGEFKNTAKSEGIEDTHLFLIHRFTWKWLWNFNFVHPEFTSHFLYKIMWIQQLTYINFMQLKKLQEWRPPFPRSWRKIGTHPSLLFHEEEKRKESVVYPNLEHLFFALHLHHFCVMQPNSDSHFVVWSHSKGKDVMRIRVSIGGKTAASQK